MKIITIIIPVLQRNIKNYLFHYIFKFQFVTVIRAHKRQFISTIFSNKENEMCCVLALDRDAAYYKSRENLFILYMF